MKVLNSKEDIKKSGIYKITNLISGKIYIGSAAGSFYNRYYEHLYALRRNTHQNDYLQKSFNKDSEESFIFEILEFCDSSKCIEREQYYLDILKPFKEIGYNICKLAGNTLGYRHSKKIKKLMSKKAKKRKINPKAVLAMKKANTGRPKSEKQKEIISIFNSIPVIQLDMKGNFIKEWSSMTEAANFINVKGANSNISGATRNGRSVGGYMWVKKSDYDPKIKYVYKGRQGKTNVRKVSCFDKQGNLIKTWDSISDAAREMNSHTQSIYNCVWGKSETHKNLIWKALN